MPEITFSIGNHGAKGMANLQMLRESFEKKSGIHVRLDEVPFSSLRWPRLVEATLYHSGPNVSKVGNSWVGDLVQMDALRPFSKGEVTEIDIWKEVLVEPDSELGMIVESHLTELADRLQLSLISTNN